MFLNPRNNSILTSLVLLTATWAASDARATVILCESELSADRGLGEEMAAWLEIDPVEISRQSTPGGMTGLPVYLAEESEREEEREKLQEQHRLELLYGSVMHVPADMSPSPTLTQTSTSIGTGSALTSEAVTPPQAALQAALPPEARLILPTGPPWEWFRPPRLGPAKSLVQVVLQKRLSWN